MRDTVTAVVSYSFKGENHELKTKLDALKTAEMLMTNDDSLHAAIASNNGLDSFSYAYEVMLTEPIIFAEASGRAASFIRDGLFDAPGYLQSEQKPGIDNTLQAIAQEHLGVSELSKQPALLNALQAAFDAGANQEPPTIP